MKRQLALPVGLSDHATFDAFLDGDNVLPRQALEGLALGVVFTPVWLCGPAGSGKSHLLQAACARAPGPAAYLPLSRLAEVGTGILDGLDSCVLVCVDDVDRVVDDDDWELALFALYNALVDAEVPLALAARAAPAGLTIRLADLRSRFLACSVLRLRMLG